MATDFKEGQSNMYHIKVKAFTVENNNLLGAEKTITVTVTKNPDDDEALRITTADVSTPENTDKVITLSPCLSVQA
jgi:hypothetical protein